LDRAKSKTYARLIVAWLKLARCGSALPLDAARQHRRMNGFCRTHLIYCSRCELQAAGQEPDSPQFKGPPCPGRRASHDPFGRKHVPEPDAMNAKPQTNPKRLFAGLTPNTFLLAFASLFADISTEMQYPVLPTFLTQTLGADGTVVGFVDGCAQALQNIVQGFTGTLSDRLRRRKSIALIGYLMQAIGKPLTGLAASWTGAFGGRCLDRLGAGARSPPRDALVASSADEKSRGRAFGLEGLGDNAGAFIGPIVTVLLLYTVHIPIRWVFYLTVFPALMAFLMTLLVRERPTRIAAKEKLEVGFRHFPRDYWIYLLVTAIFSVGNSSNAFLLLRTRDSGASLQTTILIYAAFNLVAALISYPAGTLSDRFGRRTVLLTCFGIFLITYLGFAITSTLAVIAAMFVLYGLYQGIFRAVGKAFASDLVSDAHRAGGIGWYSATVGLLGLVASVVAGILWDRIGHQAVFYYGAVFAFLGMLALVILIPDKRVRSAN
jgi:MFS family permease